MTAISTNITGTRVETSASSMGLTHFGARPSQADLHEEMNIQQAQLLQNIFDVGRKVGEAVNPLTLGKRTVDVLEARKIAIPEKIKGIVDRLGLISGMVPKEDLELVLQEQQVLLLKKIFEVGCKVGEVINTNKREKALLESENRMLEQNIAQLKMTFLAEIQSTVGIFEARKSAITVKIQGIINQLVLARALVPNDVFPFDRTTEQLSHLTKQVSSFNYDDFRKYTELSVIKRNNTESLAVKMVASQPDFPMLQEALPIIKSVSLQSIKECKALQDQAATLRAANLELIEEIEMMKDFHAGRISELHQNENKHFLIPLAEMVGVTKTRIDWEVKLVAVAIKYVYDPRHPGLQRLLRYFCQTSYVQQSRLQYQTEIDKVEGKMKEVIEMLDCLIGSEKK